MHQMVILEGILMVILLEVDIVCVVLCPSPHFLMTGSPGAVAKCDGSKAG